MLIGFALIISSVLSVPVSENIYQALTACKYIKVQLLPHRRTI